MEKNKVAAYLITEEVSEPIKTSNLKVIDKCGLFYLRFNANLQDFNIFNRNRRMYMGDAMVESLNAEHILELEMRKSWCGEAGHPDSDNPKRILTIDPANISHRIVSHNVNTQGCSGVIETLDTVRGRDMTKVILQGLESAFSLRALAPLIKKPDGSSIIKSKAHVVCYDWVILPSHKTAYQKTDKPVEKIIQDVAASGNNMCTEATVTEASEASLRSFILESSQNVKVISNVCEVGLTNARISSDKRNVILVEGSNTYIVPIEDKIKEDVSAYMRSL